MCVISTIKCKMKKEKKGSKPLYTYLYELKSSVLSPVPAPNSLDLERAAALSTACGPDISSLSRKPWTIK